MEVKVTRLYCDVCFANGRPEVEAIDRLGIRSFTTTAKVRIDVCPDHQSEILGIAANGSSPARRGNGPARVAPTTPYRFACVEHDAPDMDSHAAATHFRGDRHPDGWTDATRVAAYDAWAAAHPAAPKLPPPRSNPEYRCDEHDVEAIGVGMAAHWRKAHDGPFDNASKLGALLAWGRAHPTSKPTKRRGAA